MRVLIVDDMPVNLMIIRELFRMTNAKDVDTCANGELALSLAFQNDYDLILLDHKMPEMDGIEVLNRLQDGWKANGHKAVPVIALTGNDREGAREEYLELGFSGYVAKPVEPEKLFMACKAFLPDLHVDKTDEGARITGQVDNEPFPDWLISLNVFDLDKGRKHSGTTKNFMEGLTIFGSSIKRRAQDIEDYYNAEDWENYGLKVHALKGISGMIAATRLRELTERLEEASDAGDLDYIRAHTDEMLSFYRSIEEMLDPLFEEETPDAKKTVKGSGEPISQQELTDAYLTIRECLDFYDYNSISLILDSLEEYTLSAEEQAEVLQMRDALAVINREALEAITDAHLVELPA